MNQSNTGINKMYYSFISFLIFSLVFNYYSLLYLTKQTNWYLLHVICNFIVIIATFNDTITCFANPLLVIEQGNTNNNFKSDGLGVAVSLHFFHIIRDYKTLTMIDWTHHLISNFFSITKYAEDLNDFNHEFYYDLIYFDAFSPEKQPELWTEKNFKKLYDNLNYNGILITYCAKGLIKRTLKKVGFKIYSFPGPKGKREITQARKI